jgi:AcrR family transcriptional regulator
MDPVKQPQPDRTQPPRRERSRATRQRIAKAAFSLFCDRGYTGTTMADIAAAAGVAVQTVYFTFHTKTEVLNSTYELAVLGDGAPMPPQEQPWYRQAVAEPDVATAVRLVVEGTGEIVRRVAQLDLVVRTAAETDPEAELFLRRNEQMRVDGYREMIDVLCGKSGLRPSLTAERAADLMLLLVGPAAYRALVADRGWSQTEWVAGMSTILLEQLFGLHEGEA